MSAEEIIEQLPELTAQELELVRAKLQELTEDSGRRHQTLGQALLEFAGTAEGLPTDMAENHDHYLYGVPKRNR
jgi:hypothetical protein